MKNCNVRKILLALFVFAAASYFWLPACAKTITLSDKLEGQVEINESPAYIFDFNVTGDESKVNYTYTVAGGENFSYMNLDTSTGVIIVNVARTYIGANLSKLSPTIYLIVTNKSNGYDYDTTAFAFNISNSNDPPDLSSRTPAGADTVQINETNTTSFSVSYQDLDPTHDSANVSWFVDGVSVLNDSDDNNVSNYTYSTSLASSGIHIIRANMTDNWGATQSTSWTVNVTNIDQCPYFINATPQGIVNLLEGESVTVSINYSDPDIAYSANPNEHWLVNASWYVNGLLNATEDAGYQSNFTFNTSFYTVMPPYQSIFVNITVFLNDSQLTNSTTVLVNVTNVNYPPNITIFRGNGIELGSGEMVSTSEGRADTFAFNATDIDDNIASAIIYMNGTNISSANITTISWNFTSSGIYNITFYVNDTSGGSDNESILVNVSDNTPPVIISTSILNSSGGTDFREGDVLNISVIAEDNESNINFTGIYINRSIGGVDILISSSNTTIYVLNYTSRGTYNISFYVNDSQGLSSAYYNSTITVQAREVPPSIDIIACNNGTLVGLLSGDTVFAWEGSSPAISFTASDLNGNNTLHSPSITIDEAIPSDYVEGYSYVWHLNFSSNGIHTVNVSVYDSTDQYNSSIFYISVGNNTAPYITFAVLNSSGGGDFKEGDILNITMNVSDNQSNVMNYSIAYDGRGITAFNTSWLLQLNYSDRGSYGITFFANDSEGLNYTYILPITVSAVEKSPVFSTLWIRNDTAYMTLDENNSISVQENSLINIFARASDANGNSTIDNLTIYFNGTQVNSTASGLEISFLNATNFHSEGDINITVIAEDTTSRSARFSFPLHIVNNTAPEVYVFIQNSTGGNNYRENSTIYIFVEASDPNNNLDAVLIYNETGVIAADENATIFFPYGTSGAHNVTAVANDTEGLQTNLTWEFNIEKSYRNPLIGNFTINQAQKAELSTTGFFGGDLLAINCSIADYDGFIVNGRILKNGTLLSSEIPYNWDLDYANTGFWNITIVANNSNGMNSTYTVFVNVTENRPPNIISYSIKNSTGGTYYAEGDILNITFVAEDADSNIDAQRILMNSSLMAGNASVLHYLNYSSRGDYNITLFVNDSAGSNVSNSSIITVHSVEMHPEIAGAVFNNGTGVQLSEGLHVSGYEGRQANISFRATDLNGNSTIEAYRIYRNSSNISETNYTSLTFAYSESGHYNITLDAVDTSGLHGIMGFVLEVINNTPPAVAYSIRNSTGGTYYSEGDSLDVNMNVSDNESNIANYSIRFDTDAENYSGHVTIPLGYQSRGSHNLTFFANDTEGLYMSSSESITVNPAEMSPVISLAQIYNGSVITLNPGAQVSTHEGALVTFSFTASDQNGNSTVDQKLIYRNGSILGSSPYTWTTGMDSAGFYNITYYVNDTTGLSAWLNFTLLVSNNTAPAITDYAVLNSTGGSSYIEGDLLNISFHYEDNESNVVATRIYLNGSIISSTTNVTYNLNYSQRGVHNLTFYAEDAEGFSVNESTLLNIVPVEIRPNITVIQVNYSGISRDVSENAVIDINESDAMLVRFNASDLNGNGTLDKYSVYLDGSIMSNTNSYLWQTDFNSAGLHQIVFRVNDTTSLSDNKTIYINISNNTAPNITYFDILNSTGGNQSFYEGDTLNISAIAIDAQMNIRNITVRGTIRDGLLCENSTVNCFLRLALNYSCRGSYNFTANATDAEGLSTVRIRSILVEPTEMSPSIASMVLITARSGTFILHESDNVSLYVGEQAELRITGEDLNGNSTISSYSIKHVFPNQDEISRANSAYSYNFSSADSGLHLFNITVTDNTSRTGTSYIIINVSNNTAPSRLLFTAVNASGGDVLRENGNMSIILNATDAERNMQNLTMYYDGSQFYNHTGLDGLESVYENYTYPIPWGARGVHNVSLVIFDRGGLNYSEVLPVTVFGIEVQPSIIGALLVMDSMNTSPASQAVYHASEGASVFISFNASDDNGNNTIAATRIYINNTLVSASNTTYVSYNYSYPFHAESLYNVTLYVLDNTSLSRTLNFSINATYNTAPQVINFTVRNSTDGGQGGGIARLLYHEGEMVNISLNSSDVDSNIVSYAISVDLVNRTGTVMLSAVGDNRTIIGLGPETSYSLPYTSRGNVTFFATVTDKGNATANANLTVIVLPTEVRPAITEARVGNISVSNGDIILDYTIGDSVTFGFNASDANGNATIASYDIAINSSVLYSDTPLKSLIWSIPSSVAGYRTNVTYTVEDETGLNDTVSFIFIAQQRYVSTVSSSGSGGGGGSGQKKQASVQAATDTSTIPVIRIQGTEPFELKVQETKEIVLELDNDGKSLIDEIELTPRYALGKVKVQISDYDKVLLPGERKYVKVWITNLNYTAPFNLTFEASGVGRDLKNWLATDATEVYVIGVGNQILPKDEYDALVRYVEQLVKDNPACLELLDRVNTIRISSTSGADYAMLMEKLRAIQVDCNSRAKSTYEINDVTKINNARYYATIAIIAALLLILVVPGIYALSRLIKNAKPEKPDGDDAEIHKFLEEFEEK